MSTVGFTLGGIVKGQHTKVKSHEYSLLSDKLVPLMHTRRFSFGVH